MPSTPVFLLTGFLGAGKSTLLNRLLRDPAFADTAVVINEFGDIALDHDLVRVADKEIIRTTTGCLCCAAGSDIRTTLYGLHQAALDGARFSRVIVETTGLADPAPVVNQLIPGGAPAVGLRDYIVARQFKLAGVLAVVDIVTGELSIESHFEATKQVAFADRMVLTKTDLARDPASIRDIAELRAKLFTLNPAAPILDSHAAGFDLADLFRPRAYAPAALGEDVLGWLSLDEVIRAQSADGVQGRRQARGTHLARHGARIRTFAVTREEPVNPLGLRRFFDVLAMSAGPRLLRVKGLVNDSGRPERPRVVHVVQHVVSPPADLESWPSGDHRTRLVFITDGIDPEPMQQLFEAALDNRPMGVGGILSDLAGGLATAFRAPPVRRLSALID